MSDQTPQVPQPAPGFDKDGFPVLVQNDTATAHLPTGTAVDGVNADAELSDEQIQQALQVAMRDQAMAEMGDASRQQFDSPQQQAPNSQQQEPPAATSWAGVQEQQGQQPQGQQDGFDRGVGAPGGDAGLPQPQTQVPPTAPDPTQQVPPGYTLVPISEYNPFTGENNIAYRPVPIEDVANVLGYINSLTPAQRQRLADIQNEETAPQPQYPLAPQYPQPAASGSGPYPPGPGVQAPVPGGWGQPQVPPGYQGAPVPPQPLPSQIDYSQLDPETAALVYAQQQQLAQVQSTVQSIAAQQQQFQQQQAEIAARQMQEDRARMQRDIQAATSEFVTQHALTQEQTQLLTSRAAQLQLLPTMHQKHGGDTVAAVKETLEVAMWQSPEFRQQAIQDAIVDTQGLNADTEARRRRAGALTGGGGAVPRVAPPAQPMTRAQREQAIVSEIADAMQASQMN